MCNINIYETFDEKIYSEKCAYYILAYYQNKTYPQRQIEYKNILLTKGNVILSPTVLSG